MDLCQQKGRLVRGLCPGHPRFIRCLLHPSSGFLKAPGG
uniref:Uncharacterized protein n=1 Tax=Anguilla anguilla TaxID=7936 RepID=A0A0E9XT05_ANGAN